MNNGENNNNKNNNDTFDSLLDVIHKKREDDKKNAGISNNIPQPSDNERTKIGADIVRKDAQNTVKKPVSTKKTANQETKQVQSAGISLDDFDVKPASPKKTQVQNKKSSKGFFSDIAKIVIYLAAVIFFSIFISVNVIKIGNDVFAFVKPTDEIVIEIPENATTKDVAKILEENGVIKYPFIYTNYTQFRISRRSYLNGTYVAGTHTVTPSMNYDQLLYALSYIESSNKVVRITIPEGFTTNEILALFEKNGMKKASEFIHALQEFDYEYRFCDLIEPEGAISNLRYDINYGYRLDGYLFPDTYDFYVNENPVSVIEKLLDNFNRKFDASFYERCDELGFTVDEIITLASIIEREGNKAEDYTKISSVFHNRLKNKANYQYLESDATVQYALGTHKNVLEEGDTDVNHPYNTYENKGLPPGPISNPGYEAIYAALYPEDTNYYYFLSRNDGVTVYSRTYDQHLAAIAESNRIDAQLKAQQN